MAQEIIRDLKKETLERCKIKYSAYQEYVNDMFYDNIFDKFVYVYSDDISLNPGIAFNLFFEDELDKYLIKLIKSGDLDLEVLFINLHMNVLDLVLKKMNQTVDDKEGLMIEVIDNYDESDSFGSYLINYVKNKVDVVKR